jgi:class 3 adenylate cyclase/tetratricopeptide (TPR) repeat protein
MDIVDWLRTLGFEQYEALFRENDIDAEVLPTLADDDLRELGISSLGHRKKLLAAIAILADRSRVAFAPEQLPDDRALTSSPAERRQLTVMFCDMVGSTQLAAQLDPEDFADLIRAFQSAVAAAVAPFDGHVAKLMGDGALIYFGYPRAHEDDAEQSARAGLALVQTVGNLGRERGISLKVRVGIATGLAVVGDLMGEGEARERGVVGETPNLAARLQALAEPGEVVVAESTRRLLGGAFDLKTLGPQVLKGFDAPVQAWAIAREAENLSRFEASRRAAMTPFVGREQEVALLLERWRRAVVGEGQVVLLSGEAGVGKSRILATLGERIVNERHFVVRYQCSPHHVNDAFYPILGQIRRAANFVAGEPASIRLEKLEAMIAHAGREGKGSAPYLASLLSIPARERYHALDMAPSELKERTIAALIAIFVGLTRGAPLLALLEDAHWIDPTSVDVFSRLVERLRGLRALLVVNFRPEFAAPWLGRPHVTALALDRFAPQQAAMMVDRVVGGKALPPDVLEQIVVKTDGVPLFIEELTKTVTESDLLREENGSYILAAPLTPLAIPSTLQDSLMERLDRLASVKEIAQIGAAIGREFSYRLLEAVAPVKGAALQNALRQLVTSDLVHARGAESQATYIFKHALVQDTAYASLLRSRRRRIHADIAKALVERFAGRAESTPAIVAYHYGEAGMAELAARSWLAAAELALSRSVNIEAERYAETGLSLIPRLKKGPERHSLELALHLARANSLFLLRGYSVPETLTALTKAKRILDSGIGNDLQRFSVLFGLCLGNLTASRMEPTLALARQIVDVADQQDDTAYRLVGYRVLGNAHFFSGRHREALRALEQAARYRDPRRDRVLSFRFGTDSGLSVLNVLLCALSFLGLCEQSARVRRQVLAELPGHGHAPSIAHGKFFAAVAPELFFGDLEACRCQSAELIRYCAKKKVEQVRVWAALFHACASAILKPNKDNIAALRSEMDAHYRSGARIGSSFYLSQLAEALLMAGDMKGTETALREGLAFVQQTGERYWFAELHRIQGRAWLNRSRPDRERAQACFTQAIDIARAQEARMLELRAATDLARLYRDTASHDPRALLAPMLAAIEGGEALRDVRNARALLAGLNGIDDPT